MIQVMGPTAKPPVLFPVQKTGSETETGATISAKREEIGLMLKNSAKEQEGIFEQVNNFLKKGEEIWTGGKRELGNETFVWTDCSSWDYNSGWHDGEPDNARGNEACVGITLEKWDWAWADENCDFPLDFVCSIPICSGKCQL